MHAIEPSSPAAVTTSLAIMAAVSELYQNCEPHAHYLVRAIDQTKGISQRHAIISLPLINNTLFPLTRSLPDLNSRGHPVGIGICRNAETHL